MWVHLVLISNSLDPSPEAEDVKGEDNGIS